MLIKEQNAKRKSLTALNLYKVLFDHFQISFVTYLNINVSRLSWKNLITVFFLFHLYI